MNQTDIVTVIGATTWGNTIANLLAKKGLTVRVWAKTEARARQLNMLKEKAVSDGAIGGDIRFSSNIPEVMNGTGMAVFAVPAQTVRHTAKQFKDVIDGSILVVSLAKGLEASSGKRMTEVIHEEIPSAARKNLCVLSGPNLSQEISRGLPATSVLAATDGTTGKKAQEIFNSPGFTVFVSNDLVGVEVCGSLKNVIALGAGMVDGLGLGENAKATLITFGWAEAIKLGLRLGAKLHTFYGLAGIGDLVTTCAGSLSRNHYVGQEVASGRPLAEVKASMSNVAEGLDTAVAVHRLNHRLKLELPVIELIYRIHFQSFPPSELANRLKSGFKRY